MTFLLKRLFSNSQETVGILSLENKTLCWTLEDEKRIVKVPKETRIAAAPSASKSFKVQDPSLAIKP